MARKKLVLAGVVALAVFYFLVPVFPVTTPGDSVCGGPVPKCHYETNDYSLSYVTICGGAELRLPAESAFDYTPFTACPPPTV
jgi:hypothetical protein